MGRLTAVLNELRKQRQEKQAKLNRLDEVISTISRLTGKRVSGVRGSRRLSAAARMRIAAAQKKRWAKWRAGQRKKAA
jgi:hypothetical protein